MKEAREKCDHCGKFTDCIYLEQWDGWICSDCYWGKNEVRKKYKNIII